MFTSEIIEHLFEKHSDEYLKFDRVENKRSKRSDMHAFMMLDELFPGIGDMIAAAQHNEVWLDPDIEQICALSEDQIVELIRCGVGFEEESFRMAV